MTPYERAIDGAQVVDDTKKVADEIEQAQSHADWLSHPATQRLLAALNQHEQKLTDDAKTLAAEGDILRIRRLLTEANNTQQIAKYATTTLHKQNTIGT